MQIARTKPTSVQIGALSRARARPSAGTVGSKLHMPTRGPAGGTPPGELGNTTQVGTQPGTTKRGRVGRYEAAVFRPLGNIAAFTRFDERQPVLWASKVPIIKVDAAGCLSTLIRGKAPPPKQRGPVSQIVRNQVQL